MTFTQAFLRTLTAVARDRSAFAALIVATVLYSFFYPAAYRHEVLTDLPIVVVDQDRTALSRHVWRAIDATQGARILEEAPSLADAKRLIANRDATAIVWIAPGFEQDILRGGQGEIALLANGASLSAARASLRALATAVGDGANAAVHLQSTSISVPTHPPVTLLLRPMFNSREGYGSAVVPAVIAIIVQQTLLLGMGIVLAGRRGLSKGSVGTSHFFGVVGAFALIAFLATLYFSGFVLWVQDYPRATQLVALLPSAALFAFSAAAFGAFIASWLDNSARAGQIMLALGLPFFFLSGFSWPATSMPVILAVLAALLPSTPGVHLLVKINQMGASLSECSRELALLFAQSLIYVAAAWLRYGRRDGRRSSSQV